MRADADAAARKAEENAGGDQGLCREQDQADQTEDGEGQIRQGC